MSDFGCVPLALRRMWKHGREPAPAGPVHVSMNDYLVHRLADVPAVWSAALRLRADWPRTEGALGLWFCAPAVRRSASISIWRHPDDLRGFVRSAAHAEIMRRHRHTGDLITIAWTAERFDRRLIWEQARERMASHDSDLTAAARIREAALRLFAERGVSAASIRDVAKAAGVSAGAVQ